MTGSGIDEVDWKGELPRLLGSVLAPLAVGGVAGATTATSIETWYPTLRKPSFNPPDWIFGPVWSTLFVLMGIAHFIVSRQHAEQRLARPAQLFYWLQLALNALWSLLFFGRRSPLAAFVEIIFLWVAILLTIISFARISRKAALLLLPYLLWVSFAAFLNGAIWRLND